MTKPMPVKCGIIIAVCCNNDGKVNDNELLFDYSMPWDIRNAAASLQLQSAKMIRRHCEATEATDGTKSQTYYFN